MNEEALTRPPGLDRSPAVEGEVFEAGHFSIDRGELAPEFRGQVRGPHVQAVSGQQMVPAVSSEPLQDVANVINQRHVPLQHREREALRVVSSNSSFTFPRKDWTEIDMRTSPR
jgi:hypothetical protein